MAKQCEIDYKNLPDIEVFNKNEIRTMLTATSDSEVLDEYAKRLSGDSSYLEDRIAMADLADEDRYATLLNKFDDGSAPNVMRVDYVKLAFQHLSGMTMKQSAAFFGVTLGRISTIKHSPGFKTVLGMMTKATVETGRAFIAGAVAKATGTLISLLDAPEDKIKLMAANSILDRAGLLPPDQMVLIERSTGVHGMSEDELLAIVHNAIKDVPRQLPGGDE